MELYDKVKEICEGARRASLSLSNTTTEKRNEILKSISASLKEHSDLILKENARDLQNAKEMGISEAMIERLTLTPARINAMADSIIDIVALPDPVGRYELFERPNGLKIKRVRVPLGVVGMIYEARPNVTADSATLCLKSGNAVVLKGGKEAINSNKAIVMAIKSALKKENMDEGCVSLIEDTSREGVAHLMNMVGLIDVLIPRGGKGLIKTVVENSRVPVIETGAGVCHLYIDESADIDMAVKISKNAKCSRPSVCNAAETALVNEKIAYEFFEKFYKETREYSLKFAVTPEVCEIFDKMGASKEDYYLLTDDDFHTEYGDYIISCKLVPNVQGACEHIRKYSTGHSEAIVTNNMQNADYFTKSIDSCALYINASTRFTDGGEFGYGAEIGISTQKLHVRGPMGLDALTTEKFIIEGNGQVR